MNSFFQNFVNLLTSPVRVSTLNFNWGWALTGGKMVWDLFSGYKQSQNYQQGSNQALKIGQDNAAMYSHYGALNAEAIMGAAHATAGSILRIGEANAAAVERATERNLKLYGMQAAEEKRRHIYAEKMNAGTIRAMAGASGAQTNTGSPLLYLNSQVHEGLQQRNFLITKHKETMASMKAEGEDRAHIFRLTAQENAHITMANAEAQATVSLHEAEMRAQQSLQQGQMAYQQGQSASSGAMWGTLGSLFTNAMAGFSSFGNPFASSPATASSLSGWGNNQSFNSSGYTVPNTFANPLPAYAQATAAPSWEMPSWGGVLTGNNYLANQ